MDRNSIIGIALMGLIIIGYSIYTQPGPEELRAIQNRKDSIAKIEEQKIIESAKVITAQATDTTTQLSDSAFKENEKQQLGDFAHEPPV